MSDDTATVLAGIRSVSYQTDDKIRVSITWRPADMPPSIEVGGGYTTPGVSLPLADLEMILKDFRARLLPP